MPYRGPASPTAPDLLICAGLDPSGGAGLIADVRVAASLGARPAGVVTALTVQNTTGVVGCQACDPDLIGHQLAFLMTDIEVKAVKIGMIGSTAIAKAIANALHLTSAPVVWDPVLYPSRGDVPLVDSLFGDAITALRPHLTLVTPNARELAFMTNLPVTDLASAEAAGRALAHRLDCSVLVKGGHLAGPRAETDGLAPIAGPRAETDGLTPIAGPRAETDGLAPTAGPRAETDGLAPTAGPRAEADGLAPTAGPRAETDGLARIAEPKAEADGLAPIAEIDAIDVLVSASGSREELRAPRIRDGEHVHGTGCALSAAIAAYLANGRDLAEACRLAKDFVRDRIASPARPGRGAPAVI